MPPVNMVSLADRGRLVRNPVYQQLNELLQQLIRNGEFTPGQQFLTEREISERFGVSRVTAIKALSHLVVAGVLEFRKGVGTFVRERLLDYDLQSLMSFTRRATLARVSHFEEGRIHKWSVFRESLDSERPGSATQRYSVREVFGVDPRGRLLG